MATLHTLTPRTPHPVPVMSFSRSELSQMLSVYSRRVMSGEWRDYAIDQHDGLAMFSVFRDTNARPLFAIVKRPAEQGAKEATRAEYAPAEYALFQGPERLESSNSLLDLLATLEARPRLVTG